MSAHVDDDEEDCAGCPIHGRARDHRDNEPHGGCESSVNLVQLRRVRTVCLGFRPLTGLDITSLRTPFKALRPSLPPPSLSLVRPPPFFPPLSHQPVRSSAHFALFLAGCVFQPQFVLMSVLSCRVSFRRHPGS